MRKNATREYLNSLGFSVADHVSGLLAYWDNNQVCRFANAAYRDWFGKTPEQMVNKITIKELLGPLYEKNLPYIKEALKGNPQVFEREVPLASGNTRHSIANYIPYTLNGEVKGFFVHVTDVNTVKMQEQELKQSAEIINGQNRLLMNFANVLSNNLTSYQRSLAAILNRQTLAAQVDGCKDVFACVEKISKSFGTTASRLSEILRLLELAKLKPAHINLHDYINKASEVPRLQHGHCTNITVINKVSPAIKIFAIAGYVETILANFFCRMMQAANCGREPVIEFYALLMDKELILRIKDNGPAIDLANDWESPFDLYNVESDPADENKNGLLITRFLVECMGGRIKAETKPGSGTSFSIYFKLV